MENLTHKKAHISEETVILINATEKLSRKGIEGKIHNVGVGFGTGRHTAGASKREELKIVTKKTTSASRKRKLETTGCDAVLVSVKSEILSAMHKSIADGGNSARTASAKPDQISQGVTAKALSIVSVRDQGDQISTNRFGPGVADMNIQTTKELLDEYVAKPHAEIATETVPIVIDDRNAKFAEMAINTDPIIDERDTPVEPEMMALPPPRIEKPKVMVRKVNRDSQATDSQSNAQGGQDDLG